MKALKVAGRNVEAGSIPALLTGGAFVFFSGCSPFSEVRAIVNQELLRP